MVALLILAKNLEKQKLNYSRRAIFHMRAKVSELNFVNFEN